MTRTTILYASPSTKGQAEERYSPRQQVERLREWAGAEGHEMLVRQLSVDPCGSGGSPADA